MTTTAALSIVRACFLFKLVQIPIQAIFVYIVFLQANEPELELELSLALNSSLGNQFTVMRQKSQYTIF